MGSIRQEKIASLIKRELALIFQQESKQLFHGRFITVTNVRVTPDMSLAKVYLSIMGVKDPVEELKPIQSVAWKVRHLLAQRLAKSLRKVPELRFYIDDSLDYYDEIERLLKD
jgi:ribosome-binding factor A